MPTPGKRLKRTIPMQPPPKRYQAFLDGDLSVEDLDDEEISRMRLRGADGSFKGRAPMSIPREMAMAIQQEQIKRHKARMDAKVMAAEAALDELMSPMHIGGPGDAAKMKAAQFVIERHAGKTPDVVISTNTTKHTFEDVLEEILVDVEEEDDDFS